MKCVISGSYRKYFGSVARLVAVLSKAGIEVLSPQASMIEAIDRGFVKLTSDPEGASVGHILTNHLELIRRADYLVVYNRPWRGRPYLGPSTSLELGWARAVGTQIICLYPLDDAGLEAVVDHVVGEDSLLELLQSRVVAEEHAGCAALRAPIVAYEKP